MVTGMRNRHERRLHICDDRRDAYVAILQDFYALRAQLIDLADSLNGPSGSFVDKHRYIRELERLTERLARVAPSRRPMLSMRSETRTS